MKKFENYEEQVDYSVENMVFFNKYTEISENWFKYIPDGLSEEDEFQWFAVEIWQENEETERLGIFYDKDLELYILPVEQSSMPWNTLPAVDFSESVEG